MFSWAGRALGGAIFAVDEVLPELYCRCCFSTVGRVVELGLLFCCFPLKTALRIYLFRK